MNKLALLLFAASSAFGLSVTSVSTVGVSHGSVIVLFTTDSGFNAARIRIYLAPASCTGSGGVYQHAQFPFFSSYYNAYETETSGLTPNTNYELCPEVSNDNGTTWNTGLGAAITTLPMPAVHPAPPIPPATFNYSYPNTGEPSISACPTLNGQNYCSMTVASDCHDYMTDMQTAISQQTTHGTVIYIPPAATCSSTGNGQNGNYVFSSNPPDVMTISNSGVSGNTITLSGQSWGNGQGIIFGPDPAEGSSPYGCISGCSGNSATIQNGHVYYTCNVNLPAHTFQVCSDKAGNNVITLTPSGTSSMIVAWPRTSLYWIVSRTSTPDAQFVPPNTRITPAWDSKIPWFTSNYPGDFGFSPIDSRQVMFRFADQFNSTDQSRLLGNLYFMGIGFTPGTNPFANGSSDPLPSLTLINTLPTDNNIIFDRIRIEGKATRAHGQRMYEALRWDGLNVGIVNSYMDGMNYFHGTCTGLALDGGSAFCGTDQNGNPVVVTPTSSTVLTIAPGTAYFGAGTGTLANTATITISGTNSGTHRAYGYFDFKGQLNLVLPPGISASASGGNTNLAIKKASTSGGGRWLTGSTSAYPSNASADEYFVEPIYSSNSLCSTTQTLTGGATPQPTRNRTDGPYELGTAFTSDSAGYICGVSFWATDTATHKVNLWNATGTNLATATSPAATPGAWNSVMFSAPVGPITANAVYIASFNATNFAGTTNAFQNGGVDNAPLHVVPFYVDSPVIGDINKTCGQMDAWPQDGTTSSALTGVTGRPAVGQIGCIDITSGSISNIVIGNLITSWFASEGCQCMIGGAGPGPYIEINNYIEGSGNVWHHDDSGGQWSHPGDYTLFRNYFHQPSWTTWLNGTGQPDGPSDGNIYDKRQAAEWKDGVRIQLYGNIFDTISNSGYASGAAVAFSSSFGVTPAITDVDMQYNEIRHSTGGVIVADFGFPTDQVAKRFRISNNLYWDGNGGVYTDLGDAKGAGWWMQGPNSMEDMIVSHNSAIAYVGDNHDGVGYLGVQNWLFGGYAEGMSETNNIFYLNPRYQGIGIDGGATSLYDPCNGLEAKAVMDCRWTPNYVFDHNLLIGSNGATGANVASWYPAPLSNYIPGGSSVPTLGSMGWWNCPGTLCATQPAGSPPPDFHFQNSSSYISGGSSAANDGLDVGAPIDVVKAQEGVVTLIGVTGITSSTATVNFVAPDAQGCPVDYSSSDPTVTSNFTRVADAGGGRTPLQGGGNTRNISLSGLTGGTLYYFRVNCQAYQPTGQFKTN